MTDTRMLLGKISALRQRLEQVRGLVRDAGGEADRLLETARPSAEPPAADRQADAGRRQALVNESMRRLSGSLRECEPPALPTTLTARLRSLLEHGRAVIAELRAMAAEPLLAGAEHYPSPLPGEADTTVAFFRETAAMAETTLRLVQAFPDAPSAQLRLGDGLEVIISALSERVQLLGRALDRRKVEESRISRLAAALSDLSEGHTPDAGDLGALAEAVWREAREGLPLRFLAADPAATVERPGGGTLPGPARAVACHALTVAQVLAQLARHDEDLGARPLDAVLAGLLHDAGMLNVPAEALSRTGPLSADERRAVEGHAAHAAEQVARHLPALAGMADALACHHERLDGTGYPAGLKGDQVPHLARYLAVADTYAALACARPHRAAVDPRTALTDTLMAGERGELDRDAAEKLLYLSFYPVGSVVELADGQVGMVVATHPTLADLSAPARPVLALLTDARGRLLPTPQHLDLAAGGGRAIVRTLPPAARRSLLGRRYPELAA